MPEFKCTIKINVTADAESKEALIKDLIRKAERKEELERVVQAWLNEKPKENT